ncbi:MAG: ribbon-helix-helix protein, CopG family [Calditrichaeota bacterium]|nr:MAG: ribbon-helix-helix protein, CopG family [Calditrichota bacterium]
MKTIQMTIDEELLHELDHAINGKKITRSAFIRNSIAYYLKQQQILAKEAQHKKGYAKKPVDKEAFTSWENEQDWGI